MEKDGGLEELIEAENKKEKLFVEDDDDDDDARSSIDIRDFERRLKSSRSKRKLPGDLSSSDDDDFFDDSASQYSQSSQHSRMSSTSSQAAKSAANQQAILTSKNSIMSKVQKIKEQSQQKQQTSSSSSSSSQMKGASTIPVAIKKNVMKCDDPEVEALLKGPNPDQKVKELLSKYHQLLKSFEREKSLRQKYEQEQSSFNKTNKTDDSSFNSTASYQSSKTTKGTSVLSAINQNEENLTLKSELQKLQRELVKKEKMVSDLIADKAMGGSSASSKGLEDSKANRYEAEMKILKKERDEFFASRFDKKNGDLVKDLSNQNSKMRAKIEELESITKNR